MTTSSANASHTSQPGGGDSHVGACRASVVALRRLLDHLFPDAQNPDILTVEDVIRRYPLAQLGAPATVALEQSRRIARARRDFTQMGLAEFHAGLIYLYWGDSRAAAQQFTAARTQWSLSGDIPNGCLAHFAQGLALQHGYHFEAAMSQFGWAERCLTRNRAGAQAQQLGELGSELWPLLEEAQEAIRPKLWPEEVSRPEPTLASAPAAPIVMAAAPQAADSSSRESVSNDGSEPPLASRRAPVGDVGMPISNMPLEIPHVDPAFDDGPVPGHKASDDRHQWFVVHRRTDTLLADVTEGTWILVDTQPPSWVYGLNQQLVVVADSREAFGSVILRPREPRPRGQNYFLGSLPDDDPDPSAERTVKLDNSGYLLTIPGDVLIGIVVGFWHSVVP